MGDQRQSYSEQFKKETVKFAQEQQQKKTMRDIADELKVPLSCLHDWMTKYRQFEYEPLAVEERIKKLEQELKEKERELKEKDKKLAVTEEELAIVKKAVHIFSRPRT
ncbi:transposase [Bacillus sp. 1NLA3E]|uniref:transposase n=1 Tax=Bacillus sp. 1NLA3E TaxID=666686 RepID=UPI000247E399|nr:transposase [Bacillus sp. 1NLA3E]AGK52623.1 transposase IS3/IS911 family protein [Bacillus sp. 1NLA3E]AGK52813.1 transposase IS3/IS911 family protein [Bacillus sp. 1NLA3E]AGK54084.1 transposase IS3/IS911 family protein [Bacillus sp. 1NLA3E]AGK55029.1 transposase IS3/IS911 family protein [Bacillus sp. 1NLA3E]AGK55143.1 transposase IS3/IS911 family protein [Bacillus sp. 1NLA3E]